MLDEKIGLTRRKALLGIGTVGVGAAGAGAGTFAYFSDTEESTGNRVQAGTLDLSVGTPMSVNSVVPPLSPGGTTDTFQLDVNNGGSIDGDHVELGVGYNENDGSEPDETDLAEDVSAEEFARHLYVTTFSFGGSRIGFGGGAFGSLLNDPDGAAVIDAGGDGSSDVSLTRTADPAGGSGTGVVHASSGGAETSDYALSMRSVPDIDVSNVSSGDITYDYYGGSDNTASAPDEVYLVVEDGDGTDRLVYHAGNDDSPDAESWKTRDVGAEVTDDGEALNPGHNWFEIAPDEGNSYRAPSNGGLAADLADGTIKAVGFGRGTTRGGDTIDIYYDDLTVAGSSYEFRPVSLHDLTRGTFDSLTGIDTDQSEPFVAAFELDSMVGNPFQGDGVDVTFEFGLAQESGQNVL